MAASQTSWLGRHRVLVLIAVNAAIFGSLLLIAELALRLYIPYNPGYYMSVEGDSREHRYPYGVIKINSHGFPDDEFDLGARPRVGYMGDSVTYGVGAGYGYRFSELLAESYPEFEHMNFSGIGLTVSADTIRLGIEITERFDLDVLVYFFNLNDIVPDSAIVQASSGSAAEGSRIEHARRWILWNADRLRGTSYLYTWLRTLLKNFLEAKGLGFHGYLAYELHPHRYRSVLAETARRIHAFHDEIAKIGVEFVLVLLPYEMQISQEAAETYAGHGITWEAGFLEGSTQRLIVEEIGDDVRHIDLMPALVDGERRQESRAENAVGEYFVYNRGDKLDWNHPNRRGHRAIADYLSRIDFLGSSRSLRTSRPSGIRVAPGRETPHLPGFH